MTPRKTVIAIALASVFDIKCSMQSPSKKSLVETLSPFFGSQKGGMEGTEGERRGKPQENSK